MATKTLGTGFRFSRVMAWAPALILLVGLVFVIRGDVLAGVLFAAAAVILWIIVRRRRSTASLGIPPES